MFSSILRNHSWRYDSAGVRWARSSYVRYFLLLVHALLCDTSNWHGLGVSGAIGGHRLYSLKPSSVVSTTSKFMRSQISAKTHRPTIFLHFYRSCLPLTCRKDTGFSSPSSKAVIAGADPEHKYIRSSKSIQTFTLTIVDLSFFSKLSLFVYLLGEFVPMLGTLSQTPLRPQCSCGVHGGLVVHVCAWE